jgi:hypothetical protein
MPTETAQATQENAEVSVDAKIMADVETVKEKMDLCDKMLHPGDGNPAPSLKNNGALLQVIGFLEACGPRMVELVEAATQGALSEDVLMECLTVNDRLLKLLADIDTYAFTETTASTTSAAAPAESVEETFSDLLLDDSNDKKKTPPASGGSSSVDDDNLLDFMGLAEDSKVSADESKIPAAQPKDDFDDFLAERTGN